MIELRMSKLKFLAQQCLNLADQEDQVRFVERKPWRRYAVVFDIRGNMLMMWVR